ncbi:MAG: 16S rRNA (guanine(527)-N(7))-methyltransferase RsmG [Paramuribaculum sp.]|nr:16S rRNA (guanine(527)-N(7))-methyltransferase RsmG [Paramuribaculum sp.]MDE6323232.1 16S rRNA (guanine(527)-N(7))-methyltransferase RsmG [Paramuribaculum sp.]MDE6488058.1 16S rRNA (guanine(527)-N(7))-methyltransferase RsmG [Paramuribaculum sp.]
MHIIDKYFPTLSPLQKEQFKQLGTLYPEWNEKINVISRKDIENLYEHHILHSLAIARFITPQTGTTFLDMGTGGGFPGIPLAIMWPECRFHLIDRVGKKIKVASAIADAVGLRNVTFQHGDIGECRNRYDFVVSRAVMKIGELIPLIRKNISASSKNSFPNGLLCLKGGDLSAELGAVREPMIEVPLSDYFTEEFFQTKELIYVDL